MGIRIYTPNHVIFILCVLQKLSFIVDIETSQITIWYTDLTKDVHCLKSVHTKNYAKKVTDFKTIPVQYKPKIIAIIRRTIIDLTTQPKDFLLGGFPPIKIFHGSDPQLPL